MKSYSARCMRSASHVRAWTLVCVLLLAAFVHAGDAVALAGLDSIQGPAWHRHTIDDTAEGADGVRLGDADGDGLLDVVTGWEEGGLIRLYLNPGPERARSAWPVVTVGRVDSPEDAVLVDLDADRAPDVVSCCEGRTRSVYVHWAPRDRGQILEPQAWETGAFPAVERQGSWMFALPLDVDRQHGVDLVLGGKLAGAQLGWLRSPADPRRLADWQWNAWQPIGWTMSLRAIDMNRDGAIDVLVSDRRGDERGYYWLQNPGQQAGSQPWNKQPIGAEEDRAEFMFLSATSDPGGAQQIISIATRDDGLRVSRRTDDGWQHRRVAAHVDTGTPKVADLVDLNGDGRLDLIYTCENAHDDLRGIVWIDGWEDDASPAVVHDISGPDGVKFDRIEWLDLDGDGDLDLLTTEERAGLGVVWYENPQR